MTSQTREEFREMVLQKAKEGYIVFMTFDGPYAALLSEFIKQPTEGMLYDLNRDKVTVMSFLDDPKWINDFAVALVIEKLKSEIDASKIEIDSLKKQLELVILKLNRIYWHSYDIDETPESIADGALTEVDRMREKH